MLRRRESSAMLQRFSTTHNQSSSARSSRSINATCTARCTPTGSQRCEASDAARDVVSEQTATIGFTDKLPSILNAIEAYLKNVECGEEASPLHIGAIEGYGRKTVIMAALVLSAAKAVRVCQRKSPLTVAMLLYIALRSDNEHGRCTDSATRIADYLGCAEDVVRDLREELAQRGVLRSEPRPGLPAALWLPYVSAALQNSAHSILLTMAPTRLPAGRPRKSEALAVSAKTSGMRCPAISEEKPRASHARPIPEKGRVADPKTPGVGVENPGHLIPDSKSSSLQELNTRTSEVGVERLRAPPAAPGGAQPSDHEVKPAKRRPRATGKRPWEWVHESERKRLGEMCKAYADEHGWPEGHLRARLVAFGNYQRSHKPVSADWEASLLQWLGDPRFQPRTDRPNWRFSPSDLLDDLNVDGGLH